MQFKKILVIRLDRLGDMVLTLPAIKSLKDSFPESELSVLCQLFLKEFLLTQSYIDKVYSYNPKSSFIQTYKLFKRLRKERFDLAVDFIYAKNLRSAVFTFLSGAKKRIGFNTGIRSVFFTDKVNKNHQLKYEVERNLDIIRSLGLKTEIPKFKIDLKKHLLTDLKKKFPFLSNKKRPIVCIHPGVYKNEKRRLWSCKKFAKLADILTKKYDAAVIITGSKDEQHLAKEILSKSKFKIHNLTGQLSLIELCVLISICNLLICTLTGITHIGIMLHKPTIALAGPTPVKRWTNQRYNIITKKLNCSPCEHLPNCLQEKPFCMEAITVKDVMKVVESLIQTNPNIKRCCL